MKTTDFDVLIVGAGMAGSALACALGQAGMHVALSDKNTISSNHGKQDIRVSALNRASVQILKQLSAWPLIEKTRICPYEKLMVWEIIQDPWMQKLDKNFNRLVFEASQFGVSELGFVVENSIVSSSLQSIAKQKKTTFIDTLSIAKIALKKGHVLATTEQGEVYSAKLIVGADGAHSSIRTLAGLGVSEQEYAHHILAVNVQIEKKQHITWQAFTPEGPRALLPLGDYQGKHFAQLLIYDRPDKIARLMTMTNNQLKLMLERIFPTELPQLIAIQNRASFAPIRRHAQNYVQDSIALIGDAAHTINPLAGQGFNLGLQDVACLAETLIDAARTKTAWTSKENLLRYQKKRKPYNWQMQSLMDVFYLTFSNSIKPLVLLRNLSLSTCKLCHPIRKILFQVASGSTQSNSRLAQGRKL